MRRLLGRLWKRKRLIGIALAVFGLFNAAALYVTSQSWFCNSCHVMGSYYRSWQHDTHSQVACVDCHIAPGKEAFLRAKINGLAQVLDVCLGRESTKPSASVEDFACTRSGCHALEDVRAAGAKEQTKYLFAHANHLELEHLGIPVHCTTCHSHVKGERHFEVNTNACISCHLLRREEPAFASLAAAGLVAPDHPGATAPAVLSTPAQVAPRDCRDCHEPPPGTLDYHGLQVVHEEYLAYGAACESCHRNVTEPARAVEDQHCFACHDFGLRPEMSVEQLHRVHSAGKHKVECFSCHGMTRHGPGAASMRLAQLDCGSCHAGEHQIQARTYATTPPAGPSAPAGSPVSPMFLAHVDCAACHVENRPRSGAPDGATVAMPTAQACDSCHKPGLGAQMIAMWQRDTRQLYHSVLELSEAFGDAAGPAQPHVAEARRLLALVRQDGSWGVHNPRYTQMLLQRARESLGQAALASRGGAGVP